MIFDFFIFGCYSVHITIEGDYYIFDVRDSSGTLKHQEVNLLSDRPSISFLVETFNMELNSPINKGKNVIDLSITKNRSMELNKVDLYLEIYYIFLMNFKNLENIYSSKVRCK